MNSSIVLFLKLRLDEIEVRSSLVDEVLVLAGLDDDAVVDDGDDVGVDHGRETVRDQNASSPFSRFVESILDDLIFFLNKFQTRKNYLFAFSVERASRFIEQQNLWFSNQRPRDRDSLLLSTTELRSLLSASSFEFFGKIHHKVESVGFSQSSFDFVLRIFLRCDLVRLAGLVDSVVEAVKDVVLDCRVFQGFF